MDFYLSFGDWKAVRHYFLPSFIPGLLGGEANTTQGELLCMTYLTNLSFFGLSLL